LRIVVDIMAVGGAVIVSDWVATVEAELTALVLMQADEVTEMWTTGEIPRDNRTIERIAEGFSAVQYAPWYEGGAFHASGRDEWLSGTAEAAQRYKGQGFRWTIDNVTVLPRSPEEAAVSYRVNHWSAPDKPPTRALFLETWVKIDGRWHLHRHTAEKARPVTVV
jgi:hypothetical protein